MRENVSIIITAIISSILIVIVPLISILDRQDNMSYNVVLTYTTNFVDQVRAKGFIDKKSLDEYQEKLAATGNLYDVDYEVHHKILVPISEMNGTTVQAIDEYYEDTQIFDIDDIYNSFEETSDKSESSQKQGAYLFEEGDEFYIKLKNVNVPASSIVYRFISNESNNEIININYGGSINKVDWKLYEENAVKKVIIPEIVIGVPRHEDGSQITTDLITTGSAPNISYSYEYSHDISTDQALYIDVVLKNFDSIASVTKEQFIQDYIRLNNINATVSIIEWGTLGNENLFDLLSTQPITFTIKLEGLSRIDPSDNSSISILPNLGKSVDGYDSSGQDSVEFELVNDYTTHSVALIGPYIKNNLGQLVLLSEASRDNTVYKGEILKFELKYTAVEYVAGMEDDIKNKIRNKFNGIEQENSNIDNLTVASAGINGANNRGTFDIYFNYNSIPGTFEANNNIKVLAGWAKTLNTSDAYEAILKGNSGEYYYKIKTDGTAPAGDLSVGYMITGDGYKAAEYGSGKYLVGQKEVYLDTKDIKEEGTGLARIVLELSGGGGSDSQTLYPTGSDKIKLDISNIVGTNDKVDITVNYRLVDNVENSSSTKTLVIQYDTTGTVVNVKTVEAKDNNGNPILPQALSATGAPIYNWINIPINVYAIAKDVVYKNTIIKLFDSNGINLKEKEKYDDGTGDITTENYPVGSSGSYTFYATSKNPLGIDYTSSAVTYNIDITNPTFVSSDITGTFQDIGGKTWYKDLKIVQKLSDEHSGVGNLCRN